MSINISNMNKAEVLARLYNRAKPLGLGHLHYEEKDMNISEAKSLLESGQTYFDYVKGRVMKVDLSGDIIKTHLYNRDNGENAAEIALGIM